MQKWIVIITLLIATVVHAQPAQLIFDHYTTEAGFNSREAKDIITTPEGFVWISSDDGLARYDSKQFKFYQHNPADSQSLTYNFCGALEKDKRGWIWLVSYRELEVFDPVTEKFHHIKITGDNNKTESVWPQNFYYDSKSDIMWIGTKKGLYYSKQGSLKLERPVFAEQNKNLQKVIYSISGDDENLWITADTTIYQLGLQTKNIFPFVLPKKVNGISNEPASGYVSSYLDPDKKLWLGTWTRGLVGFNTITKEFEQYIYSDYTRQQNAITSIAQTGIKGQENILWLSTAGFGFAAFNTITQKFSSYSSDFSADLSGIKGDTYGLYTVPGQGMWIGAQTSLHYYDFTKQLFGRYDIGSVTKGEKNLPVSEIAFEKGTDGKDEKIWLAVPYRDIYLYDLQKNTIAPLPVTHAAWQPLHTQRSGYYIDSRNILWTSNEEKGIIAIDLKANKVVLNDQSDFKINAKWATCFYENKNALWIGSENGLYKANKDYSISKIEKLNEALIANGLSTIIQGITSDEQGRIWFVTDYSTKPNSSIGCYDPALNTVEFIYKETANAGSGIPLNEFYDIVFSNGKLFVADRMNGVWYFTANEKKPVLKILGQEQGLNNTRVGQLIADQKGNIWCSNSFGMACYNIKQNTFINYPFYAYGLDIERDAMAISQQSQRLYTGHTSFIHFIRTDSIAEASSPGIVFTGLNVFNKTLYKQLQGGSIIPLSYKQNTITANFVLPSFSNSFNNLYSWKLDGLEKEWTTSNNNTVTYTNLSPGRYTFRVKAANSMGAWSKEEYIVFAIKPPFYKRWWFITLVALAIIGLALYLFQLRIKRIKERYRLRTRIAADLHDEIGSTLTSITILSNVSQQAFEKEPAKVKEMLQQITSQSKTVQQNMSDIVWAIRGDNDKLENLLVRMREYAAVTLEPLNVKTNISVSELLLNKVLSLEARKELLLIYKEAVNNIAKHSGAGEVIVSLQKDNGYLLLIINDNGHWKGNGHTTGTGLVSMKQRANNIGGQMSVVHSETGTTITVKIPVT